MQTSILAKLIYNTQSLIDSGYYRQPNSQPRQAPKFRPVVENNFAIIGEIKPGSPTRGKMYDDNLLEVKIADICSVVDGISVLTEPNHFYGSLKTLVRVTSFGKPVLMKDFVINPVQIDAAAQNTILLIARILEPDKLDLLIDYALKLGSEVILEVDNEKDFLLHLDTKADLLAINNRNLETMEINTGKTIEIAREYEPNRPILGFSGYTEPTQVVEAYHAGISGVLIGTALSQSKDPGSFVNTIRGGIS